MAGDPRIVARPVDVHPSDEATESWPDELLVGGRRRPPTSRRRLWTTTAAVAIAVSAAVIVTHRSAPSHPTSAAPSGPATPTSAAGAVDACRRTTDAARINAAPLAEATGVQLLAGSPPRPVDVDRRTISPPRPSVLAGQEVLTSLLTAGDQAYGIVADCASARAAPRVVRMGRDGPVTTIVANRVGDLYADGRDVWGVAYPTAASAPLVVSRLADVRPALVPNADTVVGVAGGRLATLEQPAADGVGFDLLLRDPATGGVRDDLGPAGSAFAGAALVAWTPWPCASGSCRLDVRSPGSSAVRTYTVPDATSVHGPFSPDGHQLVLYAPTTTSDPAFSPDQVGRPLDLAVLMLDTGRIERIPGIELAPDAQVALLFSTDGRWLVIGVEVDGGTRLLLWRHGVSRVADTGIVVPGRVLGAPAVAVAP